MSFTSAITHENSHLATFLGNIYESSAKLLLLVPYIAR